MNEYDPLFQDFHLEAQKAPENDTRSAFWQALQTLRRAEEECAVDTLLHTDGYVFDQEDDLFEAEVEERASENLSRPQFLNSPFNQELFTRPQEITAEQLTLHGIPDLTFFTDLHLLSRQLGREGYDGLGGQEPYTKLAKNLPPLQKQFRKLNVLTDVMLHGLREKFASRFEKGGIIVYGGDWSDAYEAGAFLHGGLRYESALNSASRTTHPDGEIRTSMIHLTGNHDASFTGHEGIIEATPWIERFGRVDQNTFTDLIEATQTGYSWTTISRAWDASHRHLRENANPDPSQSTVDDYEIQKVAFDPMQRWYLEKLAFGPQIGRFVGDRSQVAFLNCHLETFGGRVEDLQQALEEEGYTENEPLYRQMMTYIQQERLAQDKLIEALVNDCEQGFQTTVYTHSAVHMQDKLIKTLVERGQTKEEATNFVRQKIQIYAGHRHPGGALPIKTEGAYVAKASTGALIGPIENPFSSEILEGSALTPEVISVSHAQTRQKYERLLKTARALGGQSESQKS